MLDPDGRTIMISGANRGLGRATARRLHSDGFTISAGARDVEELAAAMVGCDDDRLSVIDTTRSNRDPTADGSTRRSNGSVGSTASSTRRRSTTSPRNRSIACSPSTSRRPFG